MGLRKVFPLKEKSEYIIVVLLCQFFLNKTGLESVFMYELSFVLTFNLLNSLLLRTVLFDFHLRREIWELR